MQHNFCISTSLCDQSPCLQLVLLRSEKCCKRWRQSEEHQHCETNQSCAGLESFCLVVAVLEGLLQCLALAPVRHLPSRCALKAMSCTTSARKGSKASTFLSFLGFFAESAVGDSLWCSSSRRLSSCLCGFHCRLGPHCWSGCCRLQA